MLRPSKPITLPPVVPPVVPPVEPPVVPPVVPPVDTTVPVAFTTAAGNLGDSVGGVPFSYLLHATGTTPVFSIVDGSLPPGLTLFDDGTIYGSATNVVSEIFTFTVRVANSKSAETRTFSIVAKAPPVWETEAQFGEVSQGETFARTVKASSTNGNITEYSLVGPSVMSLSAAGNPLGGYPGLPETLRFDPQTGQFSGYYVSQDPELPIWVTPAEKLGTVVQGEFANYSVLAVPGENRSIATYGIVGSRPLPAGVSISKVGGEAIIQGIADLYANDLARAVKEVAPIWNTPSGNLGTITTRDTSAKTYAFSATAANGLPLTYMVVGQKKLLLGLVMDSVAGQVTGTLDTVQYKNLPYEPLNTISWVTSSGNLGSARNGATINVPLAVNLQAGELASFQIIAGAIPGGTILSVVNASAGTATIAGTVDAGFGVATMSASRTFTFTVSVTDRSGGQSTRTFSYTINP